MAFSLKKRVQSKSHIVSNGNDNSTTLGEVLHRSTKTKYKKNKTHQSLNLKPTTPSLEIEPSLPNENLKIYRNHCLCETHYEKQLMQHSYQLTVDKLFDLIFGSNEFVRTYHEAQRFFDETASEWLLNEATNHRERTLRYKLPYESTFIGKGTILTREKQTIFIEVPGSHYMIETEVYNEGVRFSDTFTMIIRYCLVQTSSNTTNLRVTSQIIFNKSVNGFIKQLIERNAYSASQEGLKDLNGRLNLIEDFKMEQRRLSRTGNEVIPPTPEIIRRISQRELPSIRQSSSSSATDNRISRSSDSDRLMHILIFLVFLLLIVHVYLYTKLERANFILDKVALFLKI